jgi:hypothetical protein
MPASKAVRLFSKRPRAKVQPATGRFYYNQKIGKSERTSSERGLSGLQSEDTSFTASCCQPYPKKAQRTILAPAAINYSSKLMSAVQELFQLFIIYSKKPIPTRFASGRHCSAAKPE